MYKGSCDLGFGYAARPLIASAPKVTGPCVAHPPVLQSCVQLNLPQWCHTTLNTASLLCRLETTDAREGHNAAVVHELRQAAEARLQGMEAAVASSLLQQQELYSSIHSMTGSFMQQKDTDFTALQVGTNCYHGKAGSQAERCVVVSTLT